MSNPWKTVRKNVIYQNRFGYTLRDDDVITPVGKPGKYMVLEGHGYVIIIALTKDKKVILTRQWRYPIEEESLELPAETLHENEDPLEAAKRGLKEEVGGISHKWHNLGWHWLGNGALKIKGYVYLAQNIELSDTSQEETETIKVEEWDFQKILQMIRDNQITDYRTKLGILLVQQYLFDSWK